MSTTIYYPSGVWVNSDGLPVRLPPSSYRDATCGVVAQPGGVNQTMFVDVDWAAFHVHGSDETFGQFAGGIPNNAVPSGALIISCTMNVDTAFAGASSAMNVGLVQYDGTEIDCNGLITATNGAVANLTLGATVTGSGALIGTKTSQIGYLWLSATGGDFTAGHGLLTLTYRMPTDEAIAH